MAVKSSKKDLTENYYKGDWARWSGFFYWTFEIQNGGYNMVIKSKKKAQIMFKISIQQFLMLLFTILLSDFQNSK